ncbi:MAG: hypothetical protein GW748_05440 [Alphaproteobacteria bacterium]|nr:hypothetical protein [Alphaproteobacteria bacterium]NCQ67168.1 hypothetical protein [Alphaproteobacteria bacterium]NCT07013.1 hypothetical protein [Alphaproteobacteria bacterium]
MNNCLILTNYEYAENPNIKKPLEKHINARTFSDNTIVNTMDLIKSRFLKDEDVEKINFIIKSRAHRYIAAPEKEWLYPEKRINLAWSKLRQVLLPPESGVLFSGGEILAELGDGSIHYQDQFGRTTPENKNLRKDEIKGKPPVNDPCPCGSGKKYKKCCKDKKPTERPSWTELSIRERNLKFFQGIVNILGLSHDKTWDDVRRELSDDQVCNIHRLYACLWPKETDVLSLLPKPDGTLRALYTGIIDYRLIFLPSSLSLYFDEIIVQSPFISPYNFKPEYDPVKNPHKYKQTTLNNVLLFLHLFPFIESGYINFITDPCMFDSHLKEQILNSAQEPLKKITIPLNEKRVLEKLCEENLIHTICSSTKEQQKSYLRQTNPNLSGERIEKLIKGFEIEKQQNPLVLLQDDIFNQGEGQITTINMIPNFEMSLFIAQVTGSFLLTDSPSRWGEIEKSQKSQDNLKKNWNDLCTCINNFEYIFSANSDTTFQLRKSGKLRNMREAFKEIYSSIQNAIDHPQYICPTEMLKKKFTQAYKISKDELSSNDIKYSFTCKLKAIIPTGGIENINVQRMLLSSGSNNHLKNVPMAIFLEINSCIKE